ncbi:MAG: type 4a pilus biogenesis protein PilO [Deltaproteobacteria bacterium]|nr:type 4a pilus biogenesis protein PilO [Deltaproteobacteria bacterium]
MDISKRDKKVLMIGGLAVVLFLIINYVISPFIESENDIQEGTEQKEMLLKKYERVINQRGEIEKKLAKMKREQSGLNKKLLKGSTPSLAAAEMQKMLENISKKYDLELKSVKVKDAEESGEFLAIPLEIRLTTDLNSTRKFLADLEKNSKYLIIPKLKISVKNQRDPKEVIVTLVVTGFFMKKDTEKGKEA